MDIKLLGQEPLSPSELAKRYSAQDVARSGGADIHTFGGERKVTLDFEPRREGFIWIKIGGKRALVHKDELIYIARFAKGSMAI